LIVGTALRLNVASGAEPADPADWGVQLGGPAVFEVVFRPRIVGPALLEVGGFVAAGGGFVANASLGLVLEMAQPSRTQPYVALGGGVAGGCGESAHGPGCGGIAYGYSRIGVGLQVGQLSPNLVTLDIGAWFGGINSQSQYSRSFVIPMGGIGYYW
jgi:hypothetical protein